MQRTLQHYFIFIAIIILPGCISSGSNVKQAYYDIRTTDGISTGEAKITALYHASLDRVFDNVSEDSLSAQILSQGNFWRVTLVQNKGNNIESATYLVNKINGNTKSATDIDTPVNFTSNIDNKIVSDDLSDIEKRALSRHAKLRERNSERNSLSSDLIIENQPEENTTIATKAPSISESRSVRAFPPRRADGKVNTPGNNNTARVNIDEESLVTILSSNNRITKKASDNNRKNTSRGVSAQALNASRKPTITQRTGGDAAQALQAPQTNTTTPTIPANTNLALKQTAPATSPVKPQPRENTKIANNRSTANQTTVSRTSSESRSRRNLGPRFVNAFPGSGASQSAQLPIGSTLGATTGSSSSNALSRNTFNAPPRNTFKNSLDNNAKQPAQPVFANSRNAVASQNHPVYQLKLLNEGFDAELGNRIQLKPDHDMDFSDDVTDNNAIDNETSDTKVVIENVADAIANEALTHNVSPAATVLTEPGETVSMLTKSGQIDTQSITQRDLDTDTLGSVTPKTKPDTQIASLGKPPSMAEPFFTTRGDTVVFKGATSGNKAILRKMEELVQDGYRTTAIPIMINGNKIQDEASFYELPPGSYTITMRCDSIFSASGNDKHYSYETEIQVAFVNSHEYILEAQTYRFDNQIECASDIYDIRDSR